MRHSLMRGPVNLAFLMIYLLTANPIPCCPALFMPLHQLPFTPQQETRHPVATNWVRPGLSVRSCLMTSHPTAGHRRRTTQAWSAPFVSMRGSVRRLQVAISSSHMPDPALALPTLDRVSLCSALHLGLLLLFYNICELLFLFRFFLGMPWLLTCILVPREGCRLSSLR